VRITTILARILALKQTRIRAMHLEPEGLLLDVKPTTRVPVCAGCFKRVHAAIVLVSGLLSSTLEAEGRAAGADAWLAKSELKRSTLVATIARATEAAGHRAAASHASSALPPALASLAWEVLASEEHAERTHAERTYRLVLLARAADQLEKAGEVHDACAQCARFFGVSRESIRQWTLVASRWSAKELHHLLVERRNAHGKRISAFHLYEIAHLSLAAREAWVERTFSEALSIRALREALGS
jgi:hypothetical protein